MTLTQGHLNIKIKIMVFSEITRFGNHCSMRPETLQMQTTMNSIKVCEYSRSRSFHDDLIHVLQDQASGERSQDQWSSGVRIVSDITSGHWDTVLQAIQSLKLPDQKLIKSL